MGGIFLEQFVSDILFQVRYFPRAVLLTALISGACLCYHNHFRGRLTVGCFLQQWRAGLFVFYLSYILVSTIFARETTYPCRYVFDHFGFRKDDKWNAEIVENILLFIPYTALYLTAFRRDKPWKTALVLSAATSCLIETFQLLFWLGDFQLSDIFHNTVGGVAGCALWYMVHWRRKLTKNRE